MATRAASPSPGRPPLPEEERLVSNGIHMRRASRKKFVELAAFRGRSQREILEDYLADQHARIERDPFYKRWIRNGRPIPFQEWVDAGMPSEWTGKFLVLPD